MRWPGFRDDGALILPLEPTVPDAPHAPSRVRLDGHALERKHELHMTLLGREQGRAAVAKLGEDGVRDIFDTFQWQPRGTGCYALLHKAKAQWDGTLHAWSVIEHLHEPAFAAFRDGLAQAAALALDSGIPHVTLYVAGDPYGIGLPDVPAYRACFVRDVAGVELLRAPATGR